MRNLERIVYIFLIVILTGINLNSNRIRKANAKEADYYARSISSAYDYVRRLELSSQDCDFNKDQKVINENMDSILLSELSDKHIIFLYLPPYSCQPCMDSLLWAIKDVFGKEPREVAFIGSQESMKNLKVANISNDLHLSLYFFDNYEMQIPAALEGLTFLFLLSEDLRTKLVFIPDKGKTQNTVSYLKHVKAKYFE